MKLLKKQPIALLIALIVILGATFFGANRSLGAEVRQTTAQFYDGVFSETQGRVLPSIYGQLGQRSTAALQILSIGEHSHGDDVALNAAGTELRAARQDLVALLTSGSPGELFVADQVLGVTVERYYAILHPLVVVAEGDDLAALENAFNTMQSAARVIRDSGYNEAIRDFHRTVLGRFPTNILIEIVFVSPPELFA